MIQDLENALAYVTRKTPLNPYLQTGCGLGTALSPLRSASRSASTSIVDTLNSATGRSGTGNLLFDGIMNGQRKVEVTWGSPVFVLPSSLWANRTFFVDGYENENTGDMLPISIDDYMGNPLAGSEQFVELALVQKSLQNVAKNELYKLAGVSKAVDEASDTIRPMLLQKLSSSRLTKMEMK